MDNEKIHLTFQMENINVNVMEINNKIKQQINQKCSWKIERIRKKLDAWPRLLACYVNIVSFYLYCCMIKFEADLQDWKTRSVFHAFNSS